MLFTLAKVHTPGSRVPSEHSCVFYIAGLEGPGFEGPRLERPGLEGPAAVHTSGLYSVVPFHSVTKNKDNLIYSNT